MKQTYTIATDTLGGNVDSDKLATEIITNGTITLEKIETGGGLLDIYYSSGEASVVTGIVAAHGIDQLTSLKQQRCEAIDNRSVELLADGFTYDGQQFSLSMEAQINWIGLKEAAQDGAITFPFTFSTLDNRGYTMQSASEVPVFFWQHMVATREGILQYGRGLKAAVMNCTTLEQVSAIVDPR